MTEILLVNTNREHGPLPVYPIGLCQVASAVAQAGIPVEVVDLCFASKPLPMLRQALERTRPKLIGVAIRNVDNCDHDQPVFYLPFVQGVIQAIRQVTDVPVVVGGTGVSLDPERVLTFVGADLAVAGPGDRVLVDLYRRIVEGGERWEDQPRISYGAPDDGEISPGPEFARWLDLRPYRRQAVPVSAQSRRGCPFRCVYCEYAHIEGGPRHRLIEIDEVVAKIDRAVRTTGAHVVEFVDSTFNAPPSYTIELCEALAERGVARAYHASGVTPRYGSREILEAMRACNVTAVYCSPDAGAQATIDAYRKDFTVEQLARMAQDTRELGLSVLWSFIFGGPGETPETARETLRFIREEIDPDHVVMITPRMRIYPGTGLEQISREEGYPDIELDLRAPGQFYLSDGISEEEVDALIEEGQATIGNVMSISAAQLWITKYIQAINAVTGYTKPNWKNYPKTRRIMRRFGVPWS